MPTLSPHTHQRIPTGSDRPCSTWRACVCLATPTECLSAFASEQKRLHPPPRARLKSFDAFKNTDAVFRARRGCDSRSWSVDIGHSSKCVKRQCGKVRISREARGGLHHSNPTTQPVSMSVWYNDEVRGLLTSSTERVTLHHHKTGTSFDREFDASQTN